MKLLYRRLSLITFSSVAMAFAGWQVQAETNRVTLPENIDELVHYTTVRRGNVTEHMLTSQAAIDAVKAGQPIPLGTHVILVDYREGEVFRYFVMQNGEGWSADYPDRRPTGEWQFQWIKPDGTANLTENTARCQSCHSSRADEEFLYTFNAMKAFDGAVVE